MARENVCEQCGKAYRQHLGRPSKFCCRECSDDHYREEVREGVALLRRMRVEQAEKILALDTTVAFKLEKSHHDR
jgi:hypothetical protein